MPLFPEEQNPQHRPVPTPEQQRLRQQRDDYHRQQQGGAYPVAPRPIPQQPPATRPSQGWTDEQTGYVQQGIQQSAPQPEAPEGWVLHPITGQFVKDPLYVPKAAEVVEEVKEAVTPKVSWLKWLPWILLGFLFLGGSIGGAFWAFLPDHDHDRDDYRPSSSNPAEYFIENYSAGLAELSRDVAGKIESGELEDLGSVRDYWNPRKEKISGKSFGEMGQALDSVNGDRWDRGRAVELFELFEEGFRR